MDRIVVFDLEVENHPYYGALASPVHPDNFVCQLLKTKRFVL